MWLVATLLDSTGITASSGAQARDDELGHRQQRWRGGGQGKSSLGGDVAGPGMYQIQVRGKQSKMSPKC